MRKLALSLVFLLLSFGLGNGQEIPPIDTAFVSWSPDGEYIAVATQNLIRILNAESQEIILTFAEVAGIYTAPIWSPNSQSIAFGNDTNLEIWTDLSSNPSQIAVYEGEIRGFGAVKASAWSPDGQMIAFTTGDAIDIWDTESNSLFLHYNPDGRPWSLDWRNDSATLVIGGTLFVQILNIATGIPDKSFTLEPFLSPEQYYINPYAADIALSPSQEELAIAADIALYVIKPADSMAESVISYYGSEAYYGYIHRVYSVAWHPSGAYLATSSADGTIRVWDVGAKEEIYRIEYEEYVYLHSVTWSPDGSQLVYGAPNGEAELVFVDSNEFLPND